MKMNLHDFISNFVCRNTLVRLWRIQDDGCKVVIRDLEGHEVFMEWTIFRDLEFLNHYEDVEVIGVTDVLCENYPEAVNIVLNI